MALKLSNGIYVSASAVGGSMLKDWFLVEANYTAKNRDAILAKSSGGSFNITLPLAPSVGDSIAIAPALPTYVTNPVTVLRNGQLIAGSANDLLLNSNNISIELCFVGGTVGWAIVDCGMVSVINLGPGVNTVTAGTNVTVDNTDPSNPIISSTGGSFDATANQTITGEWKFDLSGGKSFFTSDDITFAADTHRFGILNNLVAPNTIYGFSLYGSGSDSVGTYWAHHKVDKSGVVAFTAQNALGNAELNVSVSTAGVTTIGITAATVTITGVHKHVGYKTGTLASPPAGMVIGEVWADTTDSATHPIHRISTVAT